MIEEYPKETYVIHRMPNLLFCFIMVCLTILFLGMFPKHHGPPVEIEILFVVATLYLSGKYLLVSNKHTVELYANRLVYKRGFCSTVYEYRNIDCIVLRQPSNPRLRELVVISQEGWKVRIDLQEAGSNLPERLSEISGISVEPAKINN